MKNDIVSGNVYVQQCRELGSGLEGLKFKGGWSERLLEKILGQSFQ
jgi:hypothetical protein